MEKLEVDSKSGSEEEFYDCLGNEFNSFLVAKRSLKCYFYLKNKLRINMVHDFFSEKGYEYQHFIHIPNALSLLKSSLENRSLPLITRVSFYRQNTNKNLSNE